MHINIIIYRYSIYVRIYQCYCASADIDDNMYVAGWKLLQCILK